MTLTPSRYLVGYWIDRTSAERNEVLGSAIIDNEPVEHQLTYCAQPVDACDVGRNEEGDLIWISPKKSDSYSSAVLTLNPERLTRFDPVEQEVLEDNEPPLIEKRRVAFALKEVLSGRKTLVLTAGCVGILLVFVGLGLTSQPNKTLNAQADSVATSDTSEQAISTDQLTEPTEAAIEFVVTGQVPGISVPEGAARDSLHATVVSTSGEIVLVDVQVQQSEGLTTFATLLLQKSGTAWRIREVFDPR